MRPSEHIVALPNGIRVLYEPMPESRLAYVSYVFDVGSRDETPEEVGLAHFTEHMLFKGTRRRRSFHILNRIDSVGGELNAYTTKEKTHYYAIVQREHTGRAFDLLHDIAFDSVFPEKEIQRERQVIEEEIEMYADNPEESILEDFDQLMLPGHPLGQPILGMRERLGQYNTDTFLRFTRRNYVGRRLVVSVAGGLSSRQLDVFVHRHLEPLQFDPEAVANRVAPVPVAFGTAVRKRRVQQMHAVWGGMACSFVDDDYLPLLALNYLLGGPAMNNRLNLSIREKHGLTYNLYSFLNPYVDCGVWGVYAGYDPDNHSRIQKLIMRELTQLCDQPLSDRQLVALKKQFIGYLILGNENPVNRISAKAKDLLDLGHAVSLDESVAAVEELTSDELLQAARKHYDPSKLSALIYEPES